MTTKINQFIVKTNGSMTGAKVDYSRSEFQEMVAILEHLSRFVGNLSTDNFNEKHNTQLHFCVLFKMYTRFRVKAITSAAKKKIPMRFKHDEALVFLIQFQLQAIIQAYEGSPYSLNIIQKTLAELNKFYS